MWGYLVYGAVLGLSAGVAPGPLLALVISQTLQHSAKEGVRIAISPLLTDVPIICLGLILFSQLGNPDFVLGIVSFVGSAFVAYLGLSSIRQQPVELDISQEAPRSYTKGILTNALSPHPYLFWFSVGIPTIIKAQSLSWLSASGFVLVFYVCMVGSKVIIAHLVGESRQFLTGDIYLWTMKSLGVLLLGFALIILYEGLSLVGFPR